MAVLTLRVRAYVVVLFNAPLSVQHDFNTKKILVEAKKALFGLRAIWFGIEDDQLAPYPT
jgi:hypothetical protein